MRTPLDIHFFIVAAIGTFGLLIFIYGVESMRGVGFAFAFIALYAFMGVWTLRKEYIKNSKKEEAEKKNTLLQWGLH